MDDILAKMREIHEAQKDCELWAIEGVGLVYRQKDSGPVTAEEWLSLKAQDQRLREEFPESFPKPSEESLRLMYLAFEQMIDERMGGK